MCLDHVGNQIVLCPLIVEAEKGAALHGAADGDRRNAGGLDSGRKLVPNLVEHDLIPLDQDAVKIMQIREPVDGILAQTGGIIHILAEAVEEKEGDLPVIIDISFEPVKRVFHELIVPVCRQKRNPVGCFFLLH